MALTKCPECKKEISDQAGTCPRCGFLFKDKAGGGEEFRPSARSVVQSDDVRVEGPKVYGKNNGTSGRVYFGNLLIKSQGLDAKIWLGDADLGRLTDLRNIYLLDNSNQNMEFVFENGMGWTVENAGPENALHTFANEIVKNGKGSIQMTTKEDPNQKQKTGWMYSRWMSPESKAVMKAASIFILLGAMTWFGYEKVQDYRWRKAGFDLHTQKAWRGLWISLEEAQKWREVDFDPSAGEKWKRQGYFLAEAVEWRSAGFNEITASEWKDKKLDSVIAKYFRQGGLSAFMARERLDAGFSRTEAKRYGGYRRIHKGIPDGTTPAWSPDGKYIAYCKYEHRKGVIAVRKFGSDEDARVLTKGPYDTDPAWSPDGKWIAYSGATEMNNDIFIVSTNGKVKRRLTSTRDVDVSPSWSPDGKRIVFARKRPGMSDRYSIYILGLRNLRIEPIKTDGYSSDEYNPVWSPDGNHIVFERSSRSLTQICFYDLRNKKTSKWKAEKAGMIFAPSWTPDGKRVIYGDNFRTEFFSSFKLKIADLSGRRDVSLGISDSRVTAQYMRISPDGKKLVVQLMSKPGSNRVVFYQQEGT